MLPLPVLLLVFPALAFASNHVDVDRSIDPCIDFYQFACNNWNKNHPIPPTKSSLSSFQLIGDRIDDRLRALAQDPKLPGKFPELSDLYARFQESFRTCMDTARIDLLGLEPLNDFLQGFLRASFRNKSLGPEEQLLRAVEHLHEHGISALFDVGVGSDERNATVQAIYLSQTSHSLPKGDYQNVTKVQEYTEIVRSILDTMSHGLNGLVRAEDAMEIVALEKELESFTVPSDFWIDPKNYYNLVTISELSDQFPGVVDWTQYLNDSIFARLAAPLATVPPMVVYTPSYFRGLRQVLRHTKWSTLEKYLAWQTIRSLSVYYDSRSLEAFDSLARFLTGRTKRQDRWKTCLDTVAGSVQGSWGILLGKAFVHERFEENPNGSGSLMKGSHSSATTEDIIREMFLGIRSAFRDRVQTISWMDAQTKREALIKESAVHEKLLYPDYFRDPVRMREKLQGLLVDSKGRFFRNGLLQQRFAILQGIRELSKPVDKTEWGMLPQQVNAYYNPSQNEIAFPAAIFESPFFDRNRSMALNYGGIGAVIGHELSHGFDNSGRLYDAQGNLRSWWTPRSERGFQLRAQCFIRKFDQYQVFGQHVNGRLTLGENIADAGGIRLAWHAFRKHVAAEEGAIMAAAQGAIAEKGATQNQSRSNKNNRDDNFTPDQLFFLGYAKNWCSNVRPERALYLVAEDSHSPSQFRVQGVVQSMPEFQQAFSCAATGVKTDRDNCWIW